MNGNCVPIKTTKESASGVTVSPNHGDSSRSLFTTCERRSLLATSLIKSKCRKECFQKLARRRREERGDSLSFVFPPFSDNNPSAPLSVRRPNPVIYSEDPLRRRPGKKNPSLCRAEAIGYTVVILWQLLRYLNGSYSANNNQFQWFCRLTLLMELQVVPCILSIPVILLRFDIYFLICAHSILPWLGKNILTWLNLDYTEIANWMSIRRTLH